MKAKLSYFYASKLAVALCAAITLLSGCNALKQGATFNNALSSTTPTGSTTQPSTGVGTAPGSTTDPGAVPSAPIVAGIGATLPGTGALSMPTAKAVIQRVILGTGGTRGVSTSGNAYQGAVRQVTTNLANSTDPTQSVGGDANMLLAYAACGQMGAGAYGINHLLTPAQNQAQLVAAGLTILDTYLAGLASKGSASAQLNAALNAIVTQSIANGATTQIAFTTICTAALTAGSTMLGF